MGKGSLLRWLGIGRKPLPTLEEFRTRVAEEVLRRRPDADLKLVGDRELELVDVSTTNVARGYAYVCDQADELDLIVSQLADLVLVELVEPHQAAPEELIVLVRPTSFDAGGEGGEDRSVLRPLPGGLIAVVAVDTPERYIFLTASKLREQLKMDPDEVWTRARANLRERLDMTPPAYRPGQILGIKTDIGLASSFLIEDAFWSHPNLASLGDLVVAPLERDELVVAPLSEPEMVEALRRIVARRDGADFLCDRLLLRRNGAWEDFE